MPLEYLILLCTIWVVSGVVSIFRKEGVILVLPAVMTFIYYLGH